MKEHYYKGNKIIEYADHTFTAFHYNDDGDIESRDCHSLTAAQEWLDKQDLIVNI